MKEPLGSKPKYNNINLNNPVILIKLTRKRNQLGNNLWQIPTGGLGTGVFGPNISAGDPTVPLDAVST